MAKQSSYSGSVISSGSKIHTDNNPLHQPKNTHRYALNAVNRQGVMDNESSNEVTGQYPSGFVPLGKIYIGDDTNAVILSNPDNRTEIGTVSMVTGLYTSIVNTGLELDNRITNQIDIKFRLRRGNEKIIYWVNGRGTPKTFSLTKPYNFYNPTYASYLKGGGNPNTFVGEKWDDSSFNLIKSYSIIPRWAGIEILETGNTLPGSYNFAIQLVDEDLNPTGWITTSNIARIYNDPTTNSYEKIRGSKNITSDAQTFPRASKSIKLTITNLDPSFPYYRVAIIRAAGLTGVPEKVLVSDLYPTAEPNFIYTGNDSALTETFLADILIDKEVLFNVKHIEQIENKLILSNTTGAGYNWCDFQPYASAISSDLVTKEVLLNNILSEPNVKNVRSTFLYRGYMPGEVYSFGICYLMKDGTVSPIFTIPGKNPTNVTSQMLVHELNARYGEIHNCVTNNYWGNDSQGATLVGKKIRHHRFPFRKNVNKPLYTRSSSSTNITRYRLKMVITLNPAWTPGPIEFPEDGSGNPELINYTIDYQVLGAASPDSFSGQITDTDIGTNIYLYDDTTDLDSAFNPDYGELNAASELATYQDLPGGANARFIIEFTRETYILDTSINNDVSEIFGIKFSNIEKPHPDVVGFYIVRNERTEDDKIILDTAIMGAMTSNEQYRSFGLINPRPYYNVNDCTGVASSGKTLNYFNKAIWFFNPEFQYYQKRTDFNSIEIEGTYSSPTSQLPTVSDVDGSNCNSGGSRGVYVNDVQAGTSYNPEINKKKNKDDDGFDLLIGYRNMDFTYQINNATIIPSKKRILYLNAAAYQNVEDDTFYNVSVDNKIGIFIANDAANIPSTTFNQAGTSKLLYGALVKTNMSSYSNFITRPYYKEHNNPVMFGDQDIINNVNVFNGDAEISSFNFISTVFYDMVVADRPKKSGLWKIIAGAVLVVVGVVVGIFTAGAGLGISAAGVALLAGLAISYGVSLAMSGIKFEQFKNMVETDYEKGLKDTVVDGDVFATIRDTIDRGDDTIRWFGDRASNIYMESSVPFGIRNGLTSGVPDFIDAPAPYKENDFRSYLIEKLTVLDRDQGSGRLYKGYATAEFYEVNKDYLRFNKEKVFIHLPIEFDCCSGGDERYPLRHWWSETSFQEEKVDNYRVFLPNNYKDMEGELGEITDTYRLGNNFFYHTREGLWQLPQNIQERTTNEIVSFIGTGDFFSIPARRVMDDDIGVGGTQHKWATIKTEFGVFYIDELNNKIYLHTGGVKDITEGNIDWFQAYLRSFLSTQIFNKTGTYYPFDNNPSNINGVGYISTYDKILKRIIFTKKDYSILPTQLAALQVYETSEAWGGDERFSYVISEGKFYFEGEELSLTNATYFQNRSFTISYSVPDNGFYSWHSYLPNFYMHTPNGFMSYNTGNNNILRHNKLGSYNLFNNINKPFIVEIVRQLKDINSSMLEDISFITTARTYDVDREEYLDSRFVTFTKAIIYNSRQSTGQLPLVCKDTEANPENWYTQQTEDINGIKITRKGRDWNLNDLRDYVDNYVLPMFSSAWVDTQAEYPIDKVPNSSVINYNKEWSELENFRDKYIVIRLIFDTFNNVNLTFHFSVQTEQTTDN